MDEGEIMTPAALALTEIRAHMTVQYCDFHTHHEWLRVALSALDAAEARVREFGEHMAECDTKGDALDRATAREPEPPENVERVAKALEQKFGQPTDYYGWEEIAAGALAAMRDGS